MKERTGPHQLDPRPAPRQRLGRSTTRGVGADVRPSSGVGTVLRTVLVGAGLFAFLCAATAWGREMPPASPANPAPHPAAIEQAIAQANSQAQQFEDQQAWLLSDEAREERARSRTAYQNVDRDGIRRLLEAKFRPANSIEYLAALSCAIRANSPNRSPL